MALWKKILQIADVMWHPYRRRAEFLIDVFQLQLRWQNSLRKILQKLKWNQPKKKILNSFKDCIIS